MNRLIGTNYISVEGKDNALKVAATLLEQDYQVFIQCDDCNIYIVAFTSNDLCYGGPQFALLDEDELSNVFDDRCDCETRAAIERVKELLQDGVITEKDLDL